MSQDEMNSLKDIIEGKDEILVENHKKLINYKNEIVKLKEDNSKLEYWNQIKVAYKKHNVKVNIDFFLHNKDYKKNLDTIIKNIEKLSNDIKVLEEIKNLPEFEKKFEEIKKNMDKFSPHKISENVFNRLKELLSGNKTLIQNKSNLDNLITENMAKNLKTELIEDKIKKKFKDTIETYLEYCSKNIKSEASESIIENIDEIYKLLEILLNNIQNLNDEILIFSSKELNKNFQELINKSILGFDQTKLDNFKNSLATLTGKLTNFIKDYWGIDSSNRFNDIIFNNKEDNIISVNLSAFYVAEMKEIQNLDKFIETQKTWYDNLTELSINIKKLM